MIVITEIDRATWDARWNSISFSPLLQSWEYGEAQRHAKRVKVHRFLLQDEKKGPIGLVQVLVLSLPFVGGVARINRGPVFFSGDSLAFDDKNTFGAVFSALIDTCKRHRWHALKIAPELRAGDEAAALGVLEQLGFRRRSVNHASAVIDISRSRDEIRSGFHGKWRNLLNKSEAAGIALEIPAIGDAFPFLAEKYTEMQREKGFGGIPGTLLNELVRQQGPLWNCRILFATHGGERVGAVMVAGHGDTCTYLVGWTSETGRQLQANYFLLWHAMLLFKELGYRCFDVGGLGGNTTAGVGHFKRRMGGEYYALVGEMAYCSLPWLNKFL